MVGQCYVEVESQEQDARGTGYALDNENGEGTNQKAKSAKWRVLIGVVFTAAVGFLMLWLSQQPTQLNQGANITVDTKLAIKVEEQAKQASAYAHPARKNYVVAEAGKRQCPSGYSAVAQKSDCVLAAATNSKLDFQLSGVPSTGRNPTLTLPSGCICELSTGKVWFKVDGSAKGVGKQYAPICKKDAATQQELMQMLRDNYVNKLNIKMKHAAVEGHYGTAQKILAQIKALTSNKLKAQQKQLGNILDQTHVRVDQIVVAVKEHEYEHTKMAKLFAADAYTYHPRTGRFSVHGCPLNDKTTLGDIAAAAPGNFEEIHLSYCPQLTGFIGDLGQNKHMKVLDVSGLDVYGALSDLKGLTQLRELCVVGTDVDGSLSDLAGLSKLAIVNVIKTDVTGNCRDYHQVTVIGNCDDLPQLQSNFKNMQSDFLKGTR